MCASRYCASPRSGFARSWRQSKIRQLSRCWASCSVETSVVRLMTSYFGLNRFLYLPDAALVALVEDPLLDPLAAHQSGSGQDAQMLADGRLAYPQLFRQENRADPVLDGVAVDLRREMAARRLQPFQDLQAAVVRQRAQRQLELRVGCHAASI